MSKSKKGKLKMGLVTPRKETKPANNLSDEELKNVFDYGDTTKELNNDVLGAIIDRLNTELLNAANRLEAQWSKTYSVNHVRLVALAYGKYLEDKAKLKALNTTDKEETKQITQ